MTSTRFLRACLAGALLFVAAPSVRAQQPDRSAAPKPDALRSLRLPPTETFALSNGLKVYLVQKRDLPLVNVRIVFQGGSSVEPADQLGLAAMTAKMLKAGAGKRTAPEFAEEEEYLGVNISSYSDLEQSGIDFFATRDKADEGLALVRDMLTAPQFDAAELDRKRKETLAQLIQAHDNPNAIAPRAYAMTVAGAAHPAGRTSIGSEQTLKAMTVAQVRRYFDTYYTPANAYAIIVGDVDAAGAKQLLETTLGGWKGGPAPTVAPMPELAKAKGLKVVLVDKPGAAQSVLRVGHVGPARNSPDYFPIQVMNTVLGGSFTSRLNSNLRERNGYSYGAGSGYQMRSNLGIFQVATSVQTDKTGPAVKEILNELKAIKTLQPEEVVKARNNEALGFPQQFGDVQSIASNVSTRIFYRLPDNYYNTYVDNLLAVTQKTAQAAAAKHVDDRNLVIVIVGDKEKVLPQLQPLNLGKVEVLQVSDVLGPVPTLE